MICKLILTFATIHGPVALALFKASHPPALNSYRWLRHE